MIDIKKLQKPADEFKPDIRWWLAEGLNTDETLKHDLDLLKDSGFGAVEFLAMDEPGADSKIYGWGSEEWVHDSELMFRETTKRGMGVSATCGTNWSNCNLTTITPDDKAAAKELDYALERLKSGESRKGKLKKSKLIMPGVTKQEFVAVVAIRDLGEKDGKHYLDKDSAIVLNHQVIGGELNFTAPGDGEYLLFTFWIHGTGQTANPSCSVSYTVNYMDHYGIDAFIRYWDREVITPELRKTLEQNGRAMMYMDSLELATFGQGGQLWGYNFVDEFKKRRGYDIVPYLPFVIKRPGMMQPVHEYYYYMKDSVFAEKLLNDLYQTATDMYCENMMKPMKEWCNKNHMWLRSEISYGLPFEISQPGKYVDDVETESLEFASQIEPYRNLAGTAHVYGRMYSSETGATTMNYKMPLDFYTQIIYTQFAAGVTKTVLHGYSSIAGSEQSTYWPGHEGMWPIFSERFGSRQPAYQHYNDWTGMLARYQMLLREGKPRMDLAILRLDYNFNNLYFAAESGEKDLYEHQLMRGHEGIYWKDMNLQDAGYTWDYFAPQILEEDFVDTRYGVLLPDGPGYQAIVIFQSILPVTTAKKILEMARKGLPVVFVNGCSETIRPGVTVTHKKAAAMTPFNDGKDEELAVIVREIKSVPTTKEINVQSETIQALAELGIQPRVSFTEPNTKVLTLLKETEKEIIYYAYNMQYTETEDFTFTAAINGAGKPYKIDCWNGRAEEVGCYKIEKGKTFITTVLAPGEACIYVIEKGQETLHAVEARGLTIVADKGKLIAKAESSGDYDVVLSDGTGKKVSIVVPEKIVINKWNLEVEDWNEGDKVVIQEDRGVGHITTEVHFETKKTLLNAGRVELKPWMDIPEIGPDVSGVGYYTASFTTPADWADDIGCFLSIENVHKSTAAVYVNGQKAGAVDIDALKVDITNLVQCGENKIKVEVSSTLCNRLIQRGYYDMVGQMSKALAENANNAMDGEEKDKDDAPGLNFNISATPQPYGMVGEVAVNFYKKVTL